MTKRSLCRPSALYFGTGQAFGLDFWLSSTHPGHMAWSRYSARLQSPWQLSLASVWLRSTHSGSMAWSELIIFDTKIYVYISQFRKKNPLSSAGREALWRYRILNNRQIHFNINIRKTEFHFLDCITKWRKKLRKSNRKKNNPSKW